jgi:Tol biopolymer transport system component
LTNDLSDYQGVRLSADGKSLASTQARFSSELWVLPLSPPAAATPLTQGALEYFADLDVSGDGSVIACLQRSGESHLWRVSRPDGERTQLSHGAGESQPRVSRDGRSIVYLGRGPAGQIDLFAMSGDGGNARELGLEGGEENPAISGDGLTVAFVRSARDGIWVQPFAGGEAKQLIPDSQAWGPHFSPDGTKLLYATSRLGANGLSENLLVVAAAEGGGPLVELLRPASARWRWSSDQRSLLFLRLDGDGHNVWRLPLDGKPAERVTSFESTPIFDFVPADGGRSLIYSKGEIISDAVLLTSFE